MQNSVEPQYDFITRDGQYDHFLKNLPQFTQLRFITKTSLDGSKGVIIPIPHPTKPYTLIVPYYISNTSKLESSDNPIKGGPNQEVKDIASIGVLREAGYRVRSSCTLGDALSVANSLPGATKNHSKYVEVILDYYFDPATEGYKRSEKTGRPVWIHNSLLHRIFEQKVIIKSEPRDHTHLWAYNRYKKWLSQSRVTKALKTWIGKHKVVN